MEDLVTELTDMTFLDWSQRKMSPGTCSKDLADDMGKMVQI